MHLARRNGQVDAADDLGPVLGGDVQIFDLQKSQVTAFT
jgi:hypothetical protein